MSHAATTSPKPSFRVPWRVGNAVVSRGNVGWTTSKSGHSYPCQRLEEDLCWIVSHVLPATLLAKGLNWTLVSWIMSLTMKQSPSSPHPRHNPTHKYWACFIWWSWDNSVGRAPDSWLKGHGFDSWLGRRENFLLQSWLFMLSLICCQFHLHVTNVELKKTPVILPKCRCQVTPKHMYTLGGLAVQSMYCVWIYQGNQLVCISSGNVHPQSCELAVPVLTDPWPKEWSWSACADLYFWKKCRWRMTCWTLPQNPCMQGKSHHHNIRHRTLHPSPASKDGCMHIEYIQVVQLFFRYVLPQHHLLSEPIMTRKISTRLLWF